MYLFLGIGIRKVTAIDVQDWSWEMVYVNALIYDIKGTGITIIDVNGCI